MDYSDDGMRRMEHHMDYGTGIKTYINGVEVQLNQYDAVLGHTHTYVQIKKIDRSEYFRTVEFFCTVCLDIQVRKMNELEG